jgi:hypothetical protein
MCISFDELTHEQQIVVKAIFEDLPRADIPWSTVLDLFRALAEPLGWVEVSSGLICVAVMYQGSPKPGIFVCLDELGPVSRHMIEDLQDYLCGVGVEPN